MPKPKTQEFYTAIRNAHEKLISHREFGVQKFSDKWVIKKLANDFFREPRTIEDIIFYRV